MKEERIIMLKAKEKYKTIQTIQQYKQLRDRSFTSKLRESIDKKAIPIRITKQGIEEIPVIGPSLATILENLTISTVSAARRKKIIQVLKDTWNKHETTRKRIVMDMARILKENEEKKKINSPVYDKKLKEKIYGLFEEFASEAGFKCDYQPGKNFFRAKIRELLSDFKFLTRFCDDDILEAFSIALGEKYLGKSTIKDEDRKQIEFVKFVFDKNDGQYVKLSNLKKQKEKSERIPATKRAKGTEVYEEIQRLKNAMKKILIEVNAKMPKNPWNENLFKDLAKDVESKYAPNEFSEKQLIEFVSRLRGRYNFLKLKIKKGKYNTQTVEEFSSLKEYLEKIKESSFYIA